MKKPLFQKIKPSNFFGICLKFYLLTIYIINLNALVLKNKKNHDYIKDSI